MKNIDYSHMSGGLTRMLDRFKEKGTLTGDPEADQFLRENPNALLLGLLFDQRILAEVAFNGPIRLNERLGHLDMTRMAAMDPEELRSIFSEKPAIHRFTNSMAKNTFALAKVLTEQYEGDAASLWDDGAEFSVIQKRIQALPGFGPQKALKMRYVLHYFGYRDFSN